MSTSVMDPKNTNNQSTGSTGGGRQALFTPLPEVDENGKPISQPATPSPNPISSHPYFSNQPADTGDIIIGGSEPKPKQNIRPFIIGGIIFAVFVVVVTVILAIVSSQTSKTTLSDVKTAYANYVEYLESGGMSEQPTKWPLLTLVEADGDDTDIDGEYLSTLFSKYETVEDSFSRMSTDIPQNAKDYFEETFSSYGDLLETMIVYADFDNIVQTLTDHAIEGDSSAKDYADSILPESEMNDRLTENISTTLHKYFSIKIEILNLYRSNNCLADGYIDGACVAKIYSANQRLQQLNDEANELLQSLDANLPSLISIFRNSTEEIKDRLGSLNE